MSSNPLQRVTFLLMFVFIGGIACLAYIVWTDPVLMERILRNLVSNAVRYTDRGRILVGCRRRGSVVSAQVWDTGRGIPLDQQERVFQEYFQLGNPERDRTKGLGLGLAIVRRLTDLLDCRLRLRSQAGRGSCFERSRSRSLTGSQRRPNRRP
jgi:two-component system, sensor histidine kinase